jgi:hypothetical protein
MRVVENSFTCNHGQPRGCGRRRHDSTGDDDDQRLEGRSLLPTPIEARCNAHRRGVAAGQCESDAHRIPGYRAVGGGIGAEDASIGAVAHPELAALLGRDRFLSESEPLHQLAIADRAPAARAAFRLPGTL